MRNSKEQLAEILRRSEIIKNKRAEKIGIIGDCAVICLCAAVCIAAAVVMTMRGDMAYGAEGQYYGSLILKTSYMGYVVIAAAAFLAGFPACAIYRHSKELKRLNGSEQNYGRPH